MGGRENFVMATAAMKIFFETDGNYTKSSQAWVPSTAIGKNEM